MRILFLDTKANNPNRYISRAVFHGLRRDARVRDVVWADYANALQLAMDDAFDAFVAFDGEEAGNAIVERLCRLIPRRVIWFTEDPYEYYRNVRVAALFDLVFSNDAATAARTTRTARSTCRSPATGMRIFSRCARTRRATTCSSPARPGRTALHSCRAARSLSGAQAQADAGVQRFPHPLLRNVRRGNSISRTESRFAISAATPIRACSRSRLPRVFSTDPANPNLRSDTPGPRLFEAALAGSCQLVDGPDACADEPTVRPGQPTSSATPRSTTASRRSRARKAIRRVPARSRPGGPAACAHPSPVRGSGEPHRHRARGTDGAPPAGRGVPAPARSPGRAQYPGIRQLRRRRDLPRRDPARHGGG